MTTSIVDAESLLAVDIGSVNTRALLFDVADGQYRFIASASAATTLAAPLSDVSEGVQSALERLEEVSGRRLVDSDYHLIIPAQVDGSGVDRMVITFSAGSELRVVTVGLLPEVSLESANRLAESTYGRVVDAIGLTDRRRPGQQVDAILRAGADLIILAGGTDQGATRSIVRLAELITLACRVMPNDKIPQVLYAGNAALAQKMRDLLAWYQVKVHAAPNIRPDIDQEDLLPAQELLAQVVGKIRSRQLGGLGTLAALSSQVPLPASHALGRIIRFLSEIYDPAKGVLGVDLGANWTVMAAGIGGSLAERVEPLGLGAGLNQVMKQFSLEEIMRWFSQPIPPAVVRDYLMQKTLTPDSLPISDESLQIELGVARQILRRVSQDLLESLPGVPLSFEPILAGGAALCQAPNPETALLTLLDGLQPVGITTLILDPYGLTPALGAAAGVNSLLPVQVFESSAFLNLATVISPFSQARYGTPVLRVILEDDAGGRTTTEVKQGTLALLPLHHGQVGKVHLEPLRGTVIDPRRKQVNSFKITGGVLGVVVDARGRPLTLPADAGRRRELMAKWAASLSTAKVV